MSASTPPLGRPLVDPTEHFPALAALRAAVLRKDGDAVIAAFASLPDEDDRALACWAVAETPDAETFLQDLASRRPDDPLPNVLLANHLILRGWEIRSDARAEHVTREQFDAFHAHLRRAEILLIDVCAAHPRDALAWYLRLISARGLELGQSEARRRHDRLAEHHPHHFNAQSQLLQQLCPKWGGTWEEAHGYARDRAAAAPEGAPNGALVAVAQMERYLDIAQDRTKKAAEEYLREPATRAELLAASARSVLHPAARADAYQMVAAHNAFAAAHSLAGRPADAAPHFRALGDRATEFPWSYVSADHAGAFARHRKTALAQG
ncbi:hypothetical protein [Streptomyces sp. RerS4]|uniref:hypothetical protein n=1 Tax=Streptomyces sp. RerS4 TaxID=2942449 RepID=UPI00201C3EE4|nr:hypothetical protein [Streptomyces sp. RerS4]UQX02588.1 hypothetical protein M4D82_20365 [Streptomyces sp. RerS4]